MWQTGKSIILTIDGAKLEAACFGPSPGDAPTIVLLHEGLGCVALWRDFPKQLVRATGHGVFVFSRQGYGQSGPCKLPRPLDYMTTEAVEVLPMMLDKIEFQQGTLFGHSDGASIAAIHAGKISDQRVQRIVLMAPHFFAESEGLASIRAAKEAYEKGGLKPKLARYHGNVDNAFYGWNDAWLDPRFEQWNIEAVLPGINIPVMAIQGADDQYGTIAQIDVIEKSVQGPFARHILADCKHSPYLDQAERVLELVGEFVQPDVGCF